MVGGDSGSEEVRGESLDGGWVELSVGGCTTSGVALSHSLTPCALFSHTLWGGRRCPLCRALSV